MLTFEELIAQLPPEVQARYKVLEEFALGLGPDVWAKRRKYAIDFRKGTAKDWANFAIVQVDSTGALQVDGLGDDAESAIRQALTALERGDSHAAEKTLREYLQYSGDDATLILIRTDEELESAKPRVTRAYQQT